MHRSPLLLAALAFFAVACQPSHTKDSSDDTSDPDQVRDQDGDGYATGEDCDDTNAGVNPGATEVCDGVDNDCDGDTDENVQTTYYADSDGDGFGDSTIYQEACTKPAGYVPTGGDCDDTNAAAYPGNPEVCDGLDNNCDGHTDEGVSTTFYADADNDGYGDPAATQEGCTAPSGYVTDGTDCDDTTAAANPAGVERCDEIDNNCDGNVDEGVKTTYYQDTDGDNFGNSARSTEACAQPTGYTDRPDDCDDTAALVYPGSPEYCDGVDNDCDGTIDEGSGDAKTFYRDADGDGYGDASSTVVDCAPPSGYVPDATDCNDTNRFVNPGSMELCNTVDDDCDGTIDEADATDADTWYRDADGDSFGDPATSTHACTQPTGYVADNTDCDDTTTAANPIATELCDGIDNDCDGDLDEDSAADAPTWYRDRDSDGWGGTTSMKACSPPSGWVADTGDCDDANTAINPGVSEICDGVDNDCDGTIDEGDALDASTFYADTDGDGFGDAGTSVDACTMPTGYVASADDCDDTSRFVNPGATELCNGIDDNCDAVIDESTAADATTWYSDRDEDGYGDPTRSTDSCTAPSGYILDSGDCNDTNSSIYPGATELCDLQDNDCDGSVDEYGALGGVTWYADTDGDGYGDAGSTTSACFAPTGYVSNATDCDDTSARVNPAATEYCNAIDDDCDGTVDEASAADASTWYRDADGDSYGSAAYPQVACSAPTGYVASSTDCDDLSATVYPGASETCNSIDDDCDGTIDEEAVGAATYYRDADSDGYGDAASTAVSCSSPTGYVSDNTDCLDSDASVNPAGTEVCDGIDNDCSGVVDDDPVDGTDWYRDSDRDKTGDPSLTVRACSKPSGYVDNGYDCDDADPLEPVIVDIDTGSSTGAGTWTSPMASIQDGIDAANTCVAVLGGYYSESIDFTGKNISVTGVEGSANTTIDASHAGGPVVSFTTAESSAAILQGFTITGGEGYVETTTEEYWCTSILKCYNVYTTYCGGGIYLDGADPSIVDVVVEANSLPVASSTTSGVYTYYTLSYGGGICMIDSNASVDGFEVGSNFADQGGGIYADDSSAGIYAEGRVLSNDATDGGGTEVDGGSISFTNVVSADNVADTDGGGIYVIGGSIEEINVTHATEDATTGGSIYLSGGRANVMNSIIYDSSAEGVLVDGSGTWNGTYNNVYANATDYSGITDPTGSSGNISRDPLFTTSGTNRWLLGGSSPSVNAGNPSSSYYDTDGTVNDQGAFGGPSGGWWF